MQYIYRMFVHFHLTELFLANQKFIFRKSWRRSFQCVKFCIPCNLNTIQWNDFVSCFQLKHPLKLIYSLHCPDVQTSLIWKIETCLWDQSHTPYRLKNRWQKMKNWKTTNERVKHWSFQHQNIVHNSCFVNYILITPNFVFKRKNKKNKTMNDMVITMLTFVEPKCVAENLQFFLLPKRRKTVVF